MSNNSAEITQNPGKGQNEVNFYLLKEGMDDFMKF